MKQACEAGEYGFVPDYARIDILYNEGGFYLEFISSSSFDTSASLRSFILLTTESVVVFL